MNSLQRSVVKARLPKALKFIFKSLCARKGLKMNSVLENLIFKWMESNGSISNFIKPVVPQSDVIEEDIKACIDSNLKTQFKVLCAQQNISQRIVIYNLIQQWSKELS